MTFEVQSVAVVGGRRIEGAGGELYRTALQVVARPEGLVDKTRRLTAGFVDHPLVRGFGSLLLIGVTVGGWWRWLRRRRAPSAAPRAAGAGDGS